MSSSTNCQNYHCTLSKHDGAFSITSPTSPSSPVIDELEEPSPKDDDMTFCMSNYAKEALKMMFMMRSHNLLTDVILEVRQELFPAHKVVLSAASPYFKAMFTGGLKECQMNRVQIQGVGEMHSFRYSFLHVTIYTRCNWRFLDFTSTNRCVPLQWDELYISCIRDIYV